MPLTPEANLFIVQHIVPEVDKFSLHVLDELLSLDVGHTVHTGDTITGNEPLANCSMPTRLRYVIPD